MESLIVHPKNQMELNALKSVMKDMGIRYEKFHTKNLKSQKNTPAQTKNSRNFKYKPKNDQ